VRRIVRPRWVAGTVVTEYWPSRESWFGGPLVRAPGLPGRHPASWLFGSHGLAMEGTGIDRRGRFVHFAGPYGGGWLNARGRLTRPCPAGGAWTNGRPIRLASPWRARFARGPGRALTYWRSVAVDPRLIPLGSRVFLRAYCDTPARGWFVAQDTGGAIRIAHVDVYRPPPLRLEPGQMLTGETMFVVPPGTHARKLPRCA
jgi:hypothetical protein